MSRWERRKEDRPTEILNAALELFVAHGFRSTRLEDVGAKAGVTKGTIYLYYRNKEALFAEVVRSTIEPFLNEAEQTLAGYEGSAEALLRLLVDQYWTRLGHQKMASISRLMQVEGANFPELAKMYVNDVMLRGRALVMQIMDLGIARGEFRELDTLCFCEALFGVLELASTRDYTFRKFDPEPPDAAVLVNTALDMLLRGVVTPEAAASRVSGPRATAAAL